MATSIPKNRFIDQRTVLANEEARNRQISINLEKKYAKTRDALWAEHQATLYPDILHVRNVPTLQNLLANELESENQDDSLQTENLARQNLGTITDEKTTDYILDRLSMDDMFNMNQQFPEILETIKDYKNMNKIIFIDIVKSKQTYIPEFKLSERGQRRQNQADTAYEEVQNTRNRDSEVRAMRENDKNQSPEKGVGGKTLYKERLNIGDMYDDEKRSPEKSNPMRTPRKKEKGFYGNIFTASSPKPTNQDESDILERIKAEVNSLKIEQLKTYLKRFNPKITVPQYSSKEYKDMAIKIAYADETNTKTGSGLGRKRITGRGSPERGDSDEESDEEVSNGKKMFLNGGKFAVNLSKLRNCILHVYYASSRASIPSLKREKISGDARDVLLDILANKYNENLFNKLTNPDGQRLISTFVRVLKIDGIKMSEFDDAYQKNYDVLMGEVNAGNNNPKIKAELKLYILRGISENLIPKAQGQLMLYNLSL
jgi:hypothetical protein